MKKIVLCVFSLILYFLVACTLLSQKIEVQMTFPVAVKSFPGMSGLSGAMISNTALFEDEEGEHVYEVVEGSDWESGLRIQETFDWIRSRNDVCVIGSYQSSFVLSAPRQPQVGILAEIVELDEHVPSRYMLVYPNGVPDYAMLPYNTEVAAQSGNVLLLQTEDGIRPFMEHKVKASKTETYGIPKLAGLDRLAGEGWRVFCLEDVEQFLQALPSVTVALVVLGIGLVLCVFSCCLGIHAKKHRIFICLNLVLILALLCSLPHFLEGISLPSSILPRENIFEWKHYASEWSMVFGALGELGDTAQSTLELAAQMRAQSGRIVLAGALLTGVVIAAQCAVILLRKRSHAAAQARTQ